MEVRNEVLRTISKKGTGREYYVPGTKTKYTASAPGEPPVEATSQLIQYMNGPSATRVYTDGKSVKGEVGTELMKGLFLEKGTSKMAPRQWLEPSFDNSLDRVKEILSRRWF